jgi:hypothetical protein
LYQHCNIFFCSLQVFHGGHSFKSIKLSSQKSPSEKSPSNYSQTCLAQTANANCTSREALFPDFYLHLDFNFELRLGAHAAPLSFRCPAAFLCTSILCAHNERAPSSECRVWCAHRDYRGAFTNMLFSICVCGPFVVSDAHTQVNARAARFFMHFLLKVRPVRRESTSAVCLPTYLMVRAEKKKMSMTAVGANSAAFCTNAGCCCVHFL